MIERIKDELKNHMQTKRIKFGLNWTNWPIVRLVRLG
jgi:hypothetical protein